MDIKTQRELEDLQHQIEDLVTEYNDIRIAYYREYRKNRGLPVVGDEVQDGEYRITSEGNKLLKVVPVYTFYEAVKWKKNGGWSKVSKLYNNVKGSLEEVFGYTAD